MRETTEAYALASVGAVLGVYNEIVKPNPGWSAWGVLIGSVIAYDVLCPKGQTLSEVADKAVDNHQLLTSALVGVTALHLLNVLPEKYDLIHRITQLKS